MHILLKDDGSSIEDKEDILKEVQCFYGVIFQSEGDNSKVLAARRELLQYTTIWVTEEQRVAIEKIPDDEELRKTLLALPKGTSPGLDGMTSEVLLASWSFTQVCCLAMVQHFWATGDLPHSTTAGVMKVIPKKADKQKLKDWRPLTMLTIVYKLIAKLLSNNFNPHNSSLINPQQTWFILGRFILENISLAWMTHDWVVRHWIPMIFLKNDFEKAFNRVEHAYIWAVLEQVGLNGTFQRLIWGLLTNAVSKVHINGRFTEEIPLT